MTHTYDNVLGATWLAGEESPLWKRYLRRGKHHHTGMVRKVALLAVALLWIPLK